MEKPTLQKQTQTAVRPKPEHKDSEPTLKGAFASVMMVAGIIIVTWGLVFMLFIARN